MDQGGCGSCTFYSIDLKFVGVSFRQNFIHIVSNPEGNRIFQLLEKLEIFHFSIYSTYTCFF